MSICKKVRKSQKYFKNEYTGVFKRKKENMKVFTVVLDFN